MTFKPSLHLAFSIGLLALLIYVVITFYLQYRKETGTIWEKLIGAAKDSETILWSNFCIFIACIAGQLDNIADFVGAPEAKDFINSWVGNPQAVSAIMLMIAFVTIKARMRPGSNDPVK